jgi:hypothetical protein
MSTVTKFFENIVATSSGVLIDNIIDQKHSGEIDQIVIRDITSNATLINVEVRYTTTLSTDETLVYLYEDGAMPSFIDADISAPFSLRSPSLEGKLSLFLQPDANATLNVRIDFHVDRVPGSAS